LRRYISLVEAERQQLALPDERRILPEGRADTYQRFAFAAFAAGQTEAACVGIDWFKGRTLRDDLALKGAVRAALLSAAEADALEKLGARITQLQNALGNLDRNSERFGAAERAMLEATGDYDRRMQAAEQRNPRLQLTLDSYVESSASAGKLLHPD